MNENLEKDFLTRLFGRDVRFIMSNGYQEKGQIIAFDDKVIAFESKEKRCQILIYKSQVSAITPEPLDFFK